MLQKKVRYLRDTYDLPTLIDHILVINEILNSASEMRDSQDARAPIAISKNLATHVLGGQNSY